MEKICFQSDRSSETGKALRARAAKPRSASTSLDRFATSTSLHLAQPFNQSPERDSIDANRAMSTSSKARVGHHQRGFPLPSSSLFDSSTGSRTELDGCEPNNAGPGVRRGEVRSTSSGHHQHVFPAAKAMLNRGVDQDTV